MRNHSENPTISIVTICLNSARFIRHCINSVKNQTYPHIEYIVVDGGSTDGTLDIVQEYSDLVNKFISEPDKGLGDAFNKGYLLSSGMYIMYLNSDDMLRDKNSIETLMQQAITDRFPSIVYGNCTIIDRDSEKPIFTIRTDFTKRWIPWFHLYHTIPHPSSMTHRRYFERYGMFDYSFDYATDYDFFCRGTLKETISYIPETITDMRYGGVSTKDGLKSVRLNTRSLLKEKQISPIIGPLMLRVLRILMRVLSIIKRTLKLNYRRLLSDNDDLELYKH